MYSAILFNNSNLRHLLIHLRFYQLYLKISNLPPAFIWLWEVCNFFKFISSWYLNLDPIIIINYFNSGFPCNDYGPAWRLSSDLTVEECIRHIAFITPFLPDWHCKVYFCNGILFGDHSIFKQCSFGYRVLWVTMGGDRVRTEPDNCEEFFQDPLAWHIYSKGGLMLLMKNIVDHNEVLWA